MTMQIQEKLYEGKAKVLYATDQSNVLASVFKDDATAFNAQKKGTIRGKGEINCAISTHLFKLLAAKNIPTHWIDTPSPTTMRVKALEIVPLEVVVRNIAAGSLCRETALAVGTALKPSLVEFYYKNDDLGDPMLTRDRIRVLELATPEQVAQLNQMALLINRILIDFFNQCGITLVDFKLEFGIDQNGSLMLADEISPDTCRLWNQAESDPTLRVMDKDRFRHDLGDVEGAYQQVLAKVLGQAIA